MGYPSEAAAIRAFNALPTDLKRRVMLAALQRGASIAAVMQAAQQQQCVGTISISIAYRRRNVR